MRLPHHRNRKLHVRRDSCKSRVLLRGVADTYGLACPHSAGAHTGKLHALNASIDATRTSASQLNGFADVEILTRMVTHNGLDKTKKYVGRKVRTSNLKKFRIQLDGHMKVPMTRRRESGDTVIGLGGMKAFFTTGAVLKPIGSEDMESVMQLYRISEKDEDAKKKIDLQPASNRPRKQ